MYCPITPRKNVCIPPMKIMTQIVDAQPATGSPKTARRTTRKISTRIETATIPIPNQNIALSGVCEKLIMPSTAYLKSFQKLKWREIP